MWRGYRTRHLDAGVKDLKKRLRLDRTDDHVGHLSHQVFPFLLVLVTIQSHLQSLPRFYSGFTGLYLGLLGFTGFLPDVSGFNWVLLHFTWLYWFLLSFVTQFTWFYLVLPGFSGYYLILLGFTGFYRFLLGFSVFYWV